MFALCACAPLSPQPALARSGLGVRSSGPELCGCSMRWLQGGRPGKKHAASAERRTRKLVTSSSSVSMQEQLSGLQLMHIPKASRRSRHIVAVVDLHDPKVAALVAVAASQIVFNLLVFFNLDKVDEASGGRPDAGAAAADAPALERSRRPWWQRPPQVWPPRVDEPLLVAGDVLVTYSVAYACLAALTTGRGDAWLTEGSALASAWIVAAAVTNAWDPTAVLPSLGLSNALGCVARAAIDFASVRTFFALVGAVAAGQAVDVKLLALELVLGSIALALFRVYYTAMNPDFR